MGWSQISGASVIVETHFDGRAVEPSQGSHFFHNITSRGVGYLTLPVSGRGGRSDTSSYDRAWLDAQPAVRSTEAVRHVRFDEPLGVYIDGRRGRATILKHVVTPEP